MTEIEKLLLKLVKIESVSGKEKEIANFIVAQLKGFKIKKQYVSKERFNIIVRKGTSEKWIVCHMDTVPGKVKVRITKDRIYGRGACDNKGNIAGALIAAKKLENINLLFTVGEEYDFIGAKKTKIKGSRIIIMEPTEFQIISGQRGVVTFLIRTKGLAKHSAQPFKKNDNAISRMVNILSSLEKFNWTAFNIGLIDGGTAKNIVADKSEAIISVRPNDMMEYRSILREIKKKKYSNLDVEMILENAIPPVKNKKVSGKIAPYFTEMAFFENSFVFGAGSIDEAHSDDEFIKKKDLNNLVDKLASLLR